MARRATKTKKKAKKSKKTAQPAEQKILTTTNTTPLLRSAKVDVLESKISYKGPLFSVHTDYVLEPGGVESWRDVIHHSGSVVVLAIDESENRRDPYVLIEEQYRHAAGQYL